VGERNVLLTDSKQADVLAHLFKGDILYDQNLDRWYRFDPTTGLWLADLGAASILADVQSWSQRTISSGDIHGDVLDSRVGLLNVPAQARALEALRVRSEFRVTNGQWDTVSHLLGCKNGVLDLKTQRLLAPEEARQHRLTMSTGIDFHAGLQPTRFTKHMELVQPDSTMREYLFRAMGYTLTGEKGEQVWWFWYGPTTRNGKTQTADAQRLTMGDYGQHIRRELVVRNERTSAIDRGSALHAIAKARMGELPELSHVGELDSEFIKQLVDSKAAAIPYRVPYGRGDFKASPPITVIGHGNSRPEVTDSGNGFWRRVKLVSWDVQVPEDGEVRDYGQLMYDEEGEAILSLMARESALYYELARTAKDGSGLLAEPESIAEKTREYRATSDHFASWANDTLVATSNREDRVRAQWLYEAYQRWCEAQGIKLAQRINGNTFPERLYQATKAERVRKEVGMVYIGLRYFGEAEEEDA